MTEFTKEDYETIKAIMTNYVSYPLWPKYLPLLEKINAAIENFDKLEEKAGKPSAFEQIINSPNAQQDLTKLPYK